MGQSIPVSRPAASISRARRLRTRLRPWAEEVRVYRRECPSIGDFTRLMRVRLSQSAIGHWVTPTPITVTVDLETLGPSVRLRSHTTDISVLKELLIGGAYDHLPRDEDVRVVVDLGSNIGLSFRWLRARYPSARFVCVEPDPGNLEILRANVAAVDDTAIVHGACVGGHERRVTLASTSGEWGFRMGDVEGDADEHVHAIDVLTMDALIADAGIDRIDVLKCDIEGAEGELFADCRAWIGRVGAMSVECHTDVITTSALLDALVANGADFTVDHLESNPHLGFELVTLHR